MPGQRAERTGEKAGIWTREGGRRQLSGELLGSSTSRRLSPAPPRAPHPVAGQASRAGSEGWGRAPQHLSSWTSNTRVALPG
eukprot:1953541-Rhodomonas_salina.1